MDSQQAIWHSRLRAFQIWGTHQGCGKTTAAIVLMLSIATKGRGPKGAFYNLRYAKPVDRAPGEKEKENDRFQVLSAFRKWRQELPMPKYLDTKQLYHQSAVQAADATSRAVQSAKYLNERGELDESALLTATEEYAYEQADYLPSLRGLPPPGTWLFYETLDGVNARLPSGKLQADFYKPLQLPGILVGDSSPGGLEMTIKAHKFLLAHAYDVQGAFVFEDPHGNYRKVVEYFDEARVYCASLGPRPTRHEDERKDKNIFNDYLQDLGRSNTVKALTKHLAQRHHARYKAQLAGIDTHEELEIANQALALASSQELASISRSYDILLSKKRQEEEKEFLTIMRNKARVKEIERRLAHESRWRKQREFAKKQALESKASF